MSLGEAIGVAGLSSAEVAARVEAGDVNRADESTSRSLGQILRGNLFTLFNLVLGIALVMVLVVGEINDALFGFVVVFNTLIGTFTEYRAKRTLDRLAILNQADSFVERDGVEQPIGLHDIVLGDLVILRVGDQVPADGDVINAQGLEVDESLLTGESDPVNKNTGDRVLSGSAVVAGTGRVRVTEVGENAYAHRITREAKRFSLVGSELKSGINRVLVLVSWAIIPVSLLLFWSQIRDQGGFALAFANGTWREAVVQSVAGIVGMIPDGLVLLTSINFALAAMLLARQGVLAQELPAVEVLARVDVLCLDKTGTITDGTMALDSVLNLREGEDVRGVLRAICRDQENSATSMAVFGGLADAANIGLTVQVPFSSARKWSAHQDDSGAYWYFGAPEVLIDMSRHDHVAAELSSHVAGGARVLLLGWSSGPPTEQQPPSDLIPAALVVVREHVRSDAASTLSYFAEQGVTVKVISGDNPQTVAAIAEHVGLGRDHPVKSVDARDLLQPGTDLAAALESNQVFGRVSPEQKQQFVRVLQEQGHTVAMTGDGVNDALALKDADLGIAMGNGAPATKAVARLVLLDGRFSSLPPVVAQGRRVIANIERVSALFLTKSTYSAILAITVAMVAIPYPFLPRHLTLVSVLTIGTPAFFLALAPTNQRYRSGFLSRVLRLALPSGFVAAAAILVSFWILHERGEDLQANTAATLVLMIIALWLLGALARPWNWWRMGLVGMMGSIAVFALAVPGVRVEFALEWPEPLTFAIIGIVGGIGALIIEVIYRIQRRHMRQVDTSSAH